MLIGYARVSTLIKIRSTKSMPLMKADAKDIYGKIFGANKKRKQLKEALDYMREGDTLVVWKLSRLTRSMTQVINTVKDLENNTTEALGRPQRCFERDSLDNDPEYSG